MIVVADKSMDNTIEEVRKESAALITSTKLGKGASMRDGMLVHDYCKLNALINICDKHKVDFKKTL